MLKNIESNNRCFILGTAPSLNEHDLSKLKNEVVIGVNGLFYHEDIIKIKPKYFVLTSIFEGHKNYYDQSNFIPWFQDMDARLSDSTTMFLCVDDKPYVEKYNFFKNKKIIFDNYVPYSESKSINDIKLHQLPSIFSVSETAIQIALYLGFKEIFLIGFDHNWFNGIHVHFNKSEYMQHFDQNRTNNMVKTNNFDAEFQMIRHAKIFNKYKKLYKLKENIYNANSNQKTYVDTFPKVSYNNLFNKSYHLELKKAKENFHCIPSEYRSTLIKNDSINISKSIGALYQQIELLGNNNKQYVIYGYGSVGKIIQAIIPDRIIAFVDINSSRVDSTIIRNEVYSVDNLENMEYDKIIISVIGREETILNHLIEDLHINKDRIITLEL